MRLTQPIIAQIEKGQRKVGVIEFIAIANALGENPVALFADAVSHMPKRIVLPRRKPKRQREFDGDE